MQHNMISLKELCAILSISTATGRNWIKSGKLIPQDIAKKSPRFSPEYAKQIKDHLQSKDSRTLKSRRNKKYITGNHIYRSYVSESSDATRQVLSILEYIDIHRIEIHELEICTLIAECAVQLCTQHIEHTCASANSLKQYLNGHKTLHGYDFLIDDLIFDRGKSLAFIQQYPDLFSFIFSYEENEDILGLLYISTKNIGSRKATGSYYTPTKIVKRLCEKLFEKNSSAGKLILDPCCGTGNFLLQLPETIPLEHIYGNDTDILSAKIARINLALKYQNPDPDLLYQHITTEDYLNHTFSEKYDFIIGNPPWGYDYSPEEKDKLRLKYSSIKGANIESSDLFVEQAICDLTPNGVLSFVLPESLLNVKTHMPIRQFILQHCAFQYLEQLGNAFDKVQCPCIIFQMIRSTNVPTDSIGMEVSNRLHSFQIHTARKLSADYFHFYTTDDEYHLLNKLKNTGDKCFLKGHAVFALGIVTGNNKKYISTEKTDTNELILKGSDLCKYQFHSSGNYIVFQPETFQQVAPTTYYRAPEKLLYRFICNQLVFAYDNRQTLSLNSCNILIPQLDGFCVKYILAILNSRVAQFYFKKTFSSVKVLRSHIEQIPLPAISPDKQDELMPYIDTLCTSQDHTCIVKVYDELDEKISRLYQLTDCEYELIKHSIGEDNLFLS